MDKSELKKQGIDTKSIKLVKVKGYKRVFNQLPSWRRGCGDEIAVLNVKKAPNSWFNAILVEVDEDILKEFDKRERGYDRILLKDEVFSYEGEAVGECFIYVGKSEKQSDKILPNKEYQRLCQSAAKSYSEEFFQDFLETTHINI
jgi:hypothetical protein